MGVAGSAGWEGEGKLEFKGLKRYPIENLDSLG